MTKEEVLALYGEVPCKFTSYYKYTFSFSGVAPDGAKVHLDIGGNYDDIYRCSVTPESLEKLSSDCWVFAQVLKNGKEIWHENRY